MSRSSLLGRQRLPRIVAMLAGALAMHAASAQGGFSICGSLRNGYGPFDYRTDRSGNTLSIVENAHFTPAVEELIGGITGSLGGELDYTLRAFPNHHRALMSLVRLGKRMKSPQPTGAHYSIECYFDRALRFRPDDTTVRMIYANFLFDGARTAEAEAQLERVDALAGDNPFTHYNAGLIYAERKKFDKALEQARKAYALGFTRPDLRDKLKAAGKWIEPEALPQPAAASGVVAPSAAASDAMK